MNKHYPTADAQELMNQASMTAHDYMLKAVESIDQVFGEGYAENHPELVGAYMQAASQDFAAASLSRALGVALEKLTEAVESLADRE